jgi:streptogramin lyase
MKRSAVALGCLAICALLWTASASAQPVGLVEEFYVGGWAYSPTPGPGGNVWFSFDRDPVRSDDEAVGRITPQGQVTEFSAGLDPYSDLGDMAVGPDGNLWFADHGRRPAIGHITPQGTITEFRAGLDPKSKPGGIAAGLDGNVWFTDPRNSSAVGRVTPSGEITEFSTGLSPKGFPGRIVAGPDGNLWFGDTAAAIGRITPAGSITEFGQSLELGAGTAGGPVVGGDGNLWIVANGPKLGFARITPLGAVSQFSTGLSPRVSLLGPIAAGLDGNVWFTARGRPAVGRVTPSGEVAEFTDCLHRGPPYTGPNSIAAGPDGNVWFTSLTTRSLPNIGSRRRSVGSRREARSPSSARG